MPSLADRRGALPQAVDDVLLDLVHHSEILNTVFEILETEKLLDGEVELTLVPRDNLFARLLATGDGSQTLIPAPSRP